MSEFPVVRGGARRGRGAARARRRARPAGRQPPHLRGARRREHRRGHDRPERRRAAARRPSASPCSTPTSRRRRRRSPRSSPSWGRRSSRRGKVSKVSVVGTGMRTVTGVAERMFAALAAEGVNMKMITTGDIKISVLVEEDAPEEELERTRAENRSRRRTWNARRPFAGRKALRAVHAAFGLAEPAQGRRRAADQGGNGVQAAAEPARRSRREGPRGRHRPARRDGGHARQRRPPEHRAEPRSPIFDLPDRPGNCSTVFNAVATGGILVDMIVQNLTGPGRAELSFTVPRADLTRALKRTQDVVREIDPALPGGRRRGHRGAVRARRRDADAHRRGPDDVRRAGRARASTSA